MKKNEFWFCVFALLSSIVLQLVFSIPFNDSTVINENTELLLLQFIFRHGDRAPIRLYRNDPYQPKDFKEGLGELTNRGKKRMFRLGEKLRTRYKYYLDEILLKNVHARSSPRRRCLESCALVLAGMFPPRSNSEIWQENSIASLWQPIAITTIEPNRDTLLFPEAECPEATRLEKEMDESPSIRNFLNENLEFVEQLKRYTGTNFSSWLEIGYLHNTLTVEKEYFGSDFVKPEWIDQLGNDTMERLQKFHDLEFSVFHSSKNYLRLRAGSLLKELVSNIEMTLKDSENIERDKHIYLYSTHDTLLGYILSAFGSAINQPTYASGLVIELFMDSNKSPYIRILYVNGTNNFSFEALDVMNTYEDCHQEPEVNCRRLSYSRIVELLKDYFPDDIEKECHSRYQCE